MTSSDDATNHDEVTDGYSEGYRNGFDFASSMIESAMKAANTIVSLNERKRLDRLHKALHAMTKASRDFEEAVNDFKTTIKAVYNESA